MKTEQKVIFKPLKSVELFIVLHESPFCPNLDERDYWTTLDGVADNYADN